MKLYHLYIKESPLGLKYLGVTTRNPYRYRGSGKHWTRHLKCHKLKSCDIITTVLFSSFSEEEFKNVALDYSIKLNIVESLEYANLMPETGIDSTIGRECSEETRQKISKSNKGRIISPETIEKILKNRKSTKGFKHTEESKKKMSEFRKGKTLSLETIEKMRSKTKGSRLPAHFKKVYQYDLDGNFVKEWDSMRDAIDECKCDVYNAVSGRSLTAGKFQWKKFKVDKLDPFVREQRQIYMSKKVYQFNKYGKFIKEWNGTKQASLELNIHRGAIRNCLVGIAKSAGGYVWSYDEKTKNEKL